MISSFTLLEFIYLGLEIAIGCLAAVVMQPGLRLIKYLPYSRDRPGLASEETVALFLLCVLTMFGLKGLAVAGLSVEAVVSLLSLLLAACLLGAGWGAAMGIITGTILGLGNPLFYLIIGSLSFCGFWAGLLKPFGNGPCSRIFLCDSDPVPSGCGDLSGIYWRKACSPSSIPAHPQRFLSVAAAKKLGLTGCGEAEENRGLWFRTD